MQTLRAMMAMVLLLCMQSVCHAQAIYGSINGSVLDPAGAVVPGATITVTDLNKGTVRVEKASEMGVYFVHNLVPDDYSVKVEMAGFATAVSQTLRVDADRTVVFDVHLTLGTTTQTLEVTSSAPQLVVDRAEISTQLDSVTLAQTPNIGRNLTSFVLLAPGTTASTFTNANAEDPQRSTPVAANGQSAFSAGFILDGANDKDSFIGEIVVNPPLDSVQEMKFVNQDYDAEFGAAVAGVTVIQTKSGTNQFHGSAYEFRRSDAQQARDPFTQYPGNNPVGPDVPHTLSNVFGASVGGPILKNKLFFFGDYQGTRQKLGNSFFMTVPTALVHSTCTGTGTVNCDLSEYLAANGSSAQAYDPKMGALSASGANTGVGRAAFLNNKIPNSRLSAAAVNFLKLIPNPSKPGVTNNFVASGFGTYNFNQYDTRIDSQLKSNIHLFGRYGYLGSNQGSPSSLGTAGGGGFGNGGWAGSENGGNHSLALGVDVAVTPKIFTDVRFYLLRYAFTESKYDGDTTLMSNLGWAGLNTSAYGSGGAAQIAIDGMSVMGSGNHGANHCNCPLDMKEQEWGFVNNWTRDFGHHSLKVGGEMRRVHELRIPSDTNRTGELAFQSARTALGVNATNLDGTTSYSTQGGLGLASFLFGDVSTMSRYFSTSVDSAETQYRIFTYVQDNWRVTPKLTLNLGGRWELYLPESVNGKGKGGFWNLDTDMIDVAGYGKYNLSVNVKNNWALLSPRLGVAYQLTPTSVIRAGLGRAYDPGFFGSLFGAVLSQTIPVLQNQSFSQRDGYGTDAARNSDGSVYNVATGPSAPVSSYAIPSTGEFLLPLDQAPETRPNKIRLPDVFGWNVSFQQQIDKTSSVSVAYVGNKGTHTLPSSSWGGANFNDPPLYGYQQNLPCFAAPFYVRYSYLYGTTPQCGQGWYSYIPSSANSHYNSLQVVFDKRVSNGLQFQSSYVYSSAVGVAGGGYFVQDPHANWGHFDFNRTHNFKLFGGYDLPFGRGKQFGSNLNGFVDALVSGFTLNANLNWGSGLPYTLGYQDCRQDAPHWDMPCRPNVTGDFKTGAGSLNTVGHYRTYFTPVAELTANGQILGGFQRPQQFTFGSSQTNGYFGPGLFTTDATLRKTVPVGEVVKVSLEAQVQNVLNHPNLANPWMCVDCGADSGTGRITDILGGTYAGMRQIQFGTHITF